MDDFNVILKYLNDTYSIRSIVEGYPPLNPDEPGAGNSLLAPWSIISISLNTGVAYNDVIEGLEEISGAKVENFEEGGLRTEILRLGESGGIKAHEFHEAHKLDQLTVAEIMNLHMFRFVNEKVSVDNRPVKIEDAIFDLKNNTFLPDDFMPEHIMGMVEGDLSMSLEEIHKSFALNSEIRLFYLYHEQKNNAPGRVRFIYPANTVFNTELPANEVLREKLTSSFAALRSNEKYVDFENSRLLNTVIFNIDSRKSRELKRPVFDPRKIAVLETMGLVDNTSGTARIKDSVSLDQLKEKRNVLKKRGKELALEWFGSKINL
jgi:hypothetical protein